MTSLCILSLPKIGVSKHKSKYLVVYGLIVLVIQATESNNNVIPI